MSVVSIIKSGNLYKLRKYSILKSYVNDYKQNPTHLLRVFSIHRKGFTLSDWNVLRLNHDNYKEYLSSKEYYQFHPINGFYSRLIDDKLIVKYIADGTSVGKYLPEYYYMVDEAGKWHHMMDSPKKTEAVNTGDIIDLLLEKKRLAIKLVNGSIGRGFYKIEYSDGVITNNGQMITQEAFVDFLSSLKNYIISEYLSTHADMAKFWPYTANTLRYLVGCVNGEWRLIKCYIRFGTRATGEVENFNRGGVLCFVDENGFFDGGYILVKQGRTISTNTIVKHPDTNVLLTGRIPFWEEIQHAACEFEKLMPQTRYLGFDFVITNDNKIKLLEINSLTSLDAIELDCSILKTKNGEWFFSSLL